MPRRGRLRLNMAVAWSACFAASRTTCCVSCTVTPPRAASSLAGVHWHIYRRSTRLVLFRGSQEGAVGSRLAVEDMELMMTMVVVVVQPC